MSATMHLEVAQAAARLAEKARPINPHAEEVKAAAARAAARRMQLAAEIAARAAARPERPSVAAGAWWRIPVQVRILLAMPLGKGDPEQIAHTPWGSLTEEQRQMLGVIARDLRRATVEASLLV